MLTRKERKHDLWVNYHLYLRIAAHVANKKKRQPKSIINKILKLN